MQIHLQLSSLFLISLAFFSCHAAGNHRELQDLVHSSCVHARYPNICIRTFSNYPGPANTPKDLAQASVRISLAHARTASSYLKSLFPGPPSSLQASMSHSRSKRQRVALNDCMEQISESVDNLRRTECDPTKPAPPVTTIRSPFLLSPNGIFPPRLNIFL